MNAKAWFYSQSFHSVDRYSNASYDQITERQICPLCKEVVDMLIHTWAKVDGKIAHDYCVRTRAGV